METSNRMINVDNPFMVKAIISALNIRKGAGINVSKIRQYTGVRSFTSMEVNRGKDSDKGWGRLKCGDGLVCKMSSIAHFTYGYLFLKESK